MSGKRRRPPGDGSVYFDADRGMWIGSVEIGRDPRTKRRVRRKVSGRTKTEARDKLDELRAEKRATGTVARRDVTVEQVVRALLDHPPATWKSPVTIRLNGQHAQRVIDQMGKVQVAALTASAVDALLASMAARGYSRKTISGTREVLAQALRRAQRDRLVSQNVAELAEMPRGARGVIAGDDTRPGAGPARLRLVPVLARLRVLRRDVRAATG